jgi:hypothetical protein
LVAVIKEAVDKSVRYTPLNGQAYNKRTCLQQVYNISTCQDVVQHADFPYNKRTSRKLAYNKRTSRKLVVTTSGQVYDLTLTTSLQHLSR